MTEQGPPTRCSPVMADSLDWAEVWRFRMERHLSTEKFEDGTGIWKNREDAERYERHGRTEYRARVEETLAALPTGRGSVVLDIGSGPGTLALPLARKVKRVTAVEPAEGMVEVLRARSGEQGLSNITVVPKRWEDVDPARDLNGPYSLVIASLSLSMPDIREAVKKMVSVCSGSIHLIWFGDMPLWEALYAGFWEEIHGEPYYPGPKADCLLQALFQMGIFPDVRVFPLEKTYQFASPEEASVYFRHRFGLSAGVPLDALRDYLAHVFLPEGSGISLSRTSCYLHIAWDVAREY